MARPKLLINEIWRHVSFATFKSPWSQMPWLGQCVFWVGRVSEYQPVRWLYQDNHSSKSRTEKTIYPEKGERRYGLDSSITQITTTQRLNQSPKLEEIPTREAVPVQDNVSTSGTIHTDRRLPNGSAIGQTQVVASQVPYPLQSLDESPGLELYSSLITANLQKDRGSAAEVARLLQEMAAEGLQPDNSIYHDALKVLAIHPDALLRGHILETMRDHWYSLSADGWHNVVAGLLREGQLEIGLGRLEEMRHAQIEIQPWLHDMAIYILCDSLELDEALVLIQQRLEYSTSTINEAVWSQLFEVACERLHAPALGFVWNRRVEYSYLIPTTGQCMQVLSVAGRTGDVALAMSVFKKLKARGAILEFIHYETLMQAYSCRDDLRGILWVTSIMEEAKIPLNQRALEQLSKLLTQSPNRPKEGVNLLKEISQERKVPTSAFNCLIEASVIHDDLEGAVDTYKQLHQICSDGADVNTFNALFRGCRQKGRKSEAMFFAAEMLALNIQPDELTYDRLLLVCLQEQDYEDALLYYREMREAGFQPRAGTWLALVKRLATAGDERIWELLKTMKELGLDTELATRKLSETWKDKVTYRSSNELSD